MLTFHSADELLAFNPGELGTSAWLTITQTRINQFADATEDHQWIHVDPGRARHGPFGTPIAHGHLTLSLAPHFRSEIYSVTAKMTINYGTDRVRFPAPVKVGSRIRGRAELLSAEPTDDSGVQAIVRVTVEIEHEPKPACVADTVMRYYF